MDINDLTIGQAKELANLFASHVQPTESFLITGQNYLIRTVTMIYVGQLIGQNATELLLKDCSWIPETARWADMLTDGAFNEVEPYRDDVIVMRSIIADITIWRHPLPKEQK